MAVMVDERVTAESADGGGSGLVLVYDTDLRAPACVLLQAVFGCGSSPRALRHFDSLHWLTAPTPGMRKLEGTEEEWKQIAELTRERWGDKRATAASEQEIPVAVASVPRRRQEVKRTHKA